MKKEVQNESKVKKAFRVSSIIFGVLLFLLGVALLGFFGWLGYQISSLLSLGM